MYVWAVFFGILELLFICYPTGERNAENILAAWSEEVEVTEEKGQHRGKKLEKLHFNFYLTSYHKNSGAIMHKCNEPKIKGIVLKGTEH